MTECLAEFTRIDRAGIAIVAFGIVLAAVQPWRIDAFAGVGIAGISTTGIAVVAVPAGNSKHSTGVGSGRIDADVALAATAGADHRVADQVHTCAVQAILSLGACQTGASVPTAGFIRWGVDAGIALTAPRWAASAVAHALAASATGAGRAVDRRVHADENGRLRFRKAADIARTRIPIVAVRVRAALVEVLRVGADSADTAFALVATLAFLAVPATHLRAIS